MEAIRSSFRNWAIIGGFIVSWNFVQAQTLTRTVPSALAEDRSTMLTALEMTVPLPAESLPRAATYWSAQYPNWPALPGNPNGLAVWPLGKGIYVLDDRQFDYSAVSSAQAQRMSAMAMDALLLGDSGYDGGINTFNRTLVTRRWITGPICG
jgi:hypothetical protein